MLHGLAGHGGEWASTARWLGERYDIVAPDLTGDWPAQVAEARSILESLGGPAIVVGQSLGGLIAIRLAAARPDLVRALVVAEASPAGAEDAAAAAAEVGAALRRWPMPFASREAAVAFFGGRSVSADAWADGLAQRDGGWWPRFDVDVMERTLREALSEPLWDEWERAACPALVVRAGRGTLCFADAQAMLGRAHDARLAELPDAGHDLHLEQPKEWRRVVSEFLESLGL